MKYYKNILNNHSKTELGHKKYQGSITEFKDDDKIIYVNVYRFYAAYNGFNHRITDNYYVFCQIKNSGEYTKHIISNADVSISRLDAAIVNHIKIFGSF